MIPWFQLGSLNPRVFHATGACCSGDTPHCCHDEAGRPVCINENQCCTTDECVGAGFDGACVDCDLSTFTCKAVNDGSDCPGTECGVCQTGHCSPDQGRCDACEQCLPTLSCARVCHEDGCFCQVCETCSDLQLCEPLCASTLTCCFDVCFDGADQTCCLNDDDCLGDCQSCQFGPGQVGICVSACTPEQPKCCANRFTSICTTEGTVCCDGDGDCQAIPTYCETQPDGDLLWRYHLCSGSICVLTAHPCNLADNVCERDTCGDATDCDVEIIPPGQLATDGVSICCNSDDDCAQLPRFCDDDDLFHYWLCGGPYTCQKTGNQCSPGQCDDILGCQEIGP